MSLEYEKARRLTSQQRDAVLDLAVRLQTEHDATTGLEELTEAAAQAGIDPEFVRQAVARVDARPASRTWTRPEPFHVDRWFTLESFVVSATVLSIVLNLRQEGHRDPGTTCALVFAAAALLGFHGQMRRVPLWLVPTVACAVGYLFAGSGNLSLEGLDPSANFTAQGPLVLLVGPLTGALVGWIVQSWLDNRDAAKLG